MKNVMNTYNLDTEAMKELKNQVCLMTATDDALEYGINIEDYLSSIHNLAEMSAKMSDAELAVRSEMLRDELKDKKVDCPEGDFIYWGGRCFELKKDWNDSADEKKARAARMAQAIIDRADQNYELVEGELADVLCEDALTDNETLEYRSEILAELYREKFDPDFAFAGYGNFTVLPDGSVYLLYHMYDHEIDDMFQAYDDEDDGMLFCYDE